MAIYPRLGNDNWSLGSNPYFHFDPETKHIEDKIFECRGIIINERFWNRIRDELLDLMKESGPLILYQLGLSYGLEVGARGKDIVDDPQTAAKFLEFYGLMAGWGRFETSGFEPQSGRVEGMIVKVYDSFFASSAKSTTGNPSCFFVSGLLAGIADGLFGPCHNCMEKNCTSAGSECCEFIVTAALLTTFSYLARLTGRVQLGEFCKKVAEIDSRINTVIVIKETELEGGYSIPGQWVPDLKILKRLLMQVQLVVGIARSNAEIYGDLGHVMLTHEIADFFFFPLEDRRVFLVSINRPYDHNALEPKLAERHRALKAMLQG